MRHVAGVCQGGDPGDSRWRTRDRGSPGGAKNIFEPFQRVDSGDLGGTGLGLAIANRQVKLMGGVLNVDPQRAMDRSFTSLCSCRVTAGK